MPTLESGVVRHLVRKAVVSTLTLAAIVFLLLLTWQERHILSEWSTTLDLWWFCLCVLLLLVSNFFGAAIFAMLTGKSALRAPNAQRIWAAYLFGQLAKYVPGRIWSVVQQTAVLSGTVNARVVVFANLVWFTLALVLTTGVGLALLLYSRGETWLPILISLLTLLAAVFALRTLTTARQLDQLVCRLTGSKRTTNLQGVTNGADSAFISRATYLYLAAFSLFFTLGWCLFFAAALGLGSNDAILLTSILALSSVVGMLSFMPGGLGAREIAMIIIGGILAEDAATLPALAVATRSTIVVVDLLSFSIGSVVLIYSRMGSGDNA